MKTGAQYAVRFKVPHRTCYCRCCGSMRWSTRNWLRCCRRRRADAICPACPGNTIGSSKAMCEYPHIVRKAPMSEGEPTLLVARSCRRITGNAGGNLADVDVGRISRAVGSIAARCGAALVDGALEMAVGPRCRTSRVDAPPPSTSHRLTTPSAGSPPKKLLLHTANPLTVFDIQRPSTP